MATSFSVASSSALFLGNPQFEPCCRRAGVQKVSVCSAKHQVRCEQREEASSSGGNGSVDVAVSRRHAAAAVALWGLGVWWGTAPRAVALLENDDDEALLEKVKEDKRRRIQSRSKAINSFKKETESVQAAVYRLSKAGQAIDGADFSTATSVLDSDWVNEVKAALSKVSDNSEERSEADVFSTALASLQAAVGRQDAESSKSAFVESASALEKWSRLTGFSNQITGL